MTRIRLLSLALGLALVPAVAGAQTTGSAEGGETYGGAQVGEDVAPIEQQEKEAEPLMPEEKAAPSGAAEGGETYGTVMEPLPPAEEPPPAVEEAPPPPMDVTMEAEEVEEEPRGITSFGMAISAGGGVIDYIDDDAQGLTDLGGAWDVRLSLGTRSWIGVEAGYVGWASDIDALGLDPDAALMSNGLEGLVRVNLGTFDIQPYAVAGIGWQHFDIINEDFNTSSVNDEDDVTTVPVGAGVSTYIGRSASGAFMLDARFVYRPTFDEDLFDPGTGNEEDEDLDSWSVTARLGYEF